MTSSTVGYKEETVVWSAASFQPQHMHTSYLGKVKFFAHVTNYSFKSNKLQSRVLKSKSNKLNTIVSKVSNKLNYEASKSNKLNLNSLKWTNIDVGVWYMMRV